MTLVRGMRLLLQKYQYLIVSAAILLAITVMGLCTLVSGHTMVEAKKALKGEVFSY
jgi:hypothetical protein